MVSTQEWLEQVYPDQETESIYINQQIEGVLDCREYENLERIFISSRVDSSNFEIKNAFFWIGEIKETKIIPCISAQEYIDQEYPKNGTCIKKDRYDENKKHEDYNKTRTQITKLDISYKGLEGDLDLSDFINLEKLDCSGNCLTNLNINNCKWLEEINCYDNQFTILNLSNLKQLEILRCFDNYLTQIIFPADFESIIWLDIRNNNLFSQNLSIFSKFVNLEYLNISSWDKVKITQGIYNRFHGSLDYLSGMNNLKELGISNTDLNEVNIDKLPKSLEIVYHSTKERPNCKLTAIVPCLDKHFGEHGRCLECNQLNTGQRWCHPCAEKEWTEDIKNLTRQEVIKRFIKQQNLKRWGNGLKWIPYEQFTDIEHLADGGFSKIYKAKWQENKGGKKNDEGEWEKLNYTDVVLKFLTNSQNITLAFLREISNTCLFGTPGGSGGTTLGIATLWGITYDSKTKNFVTVADYKEEGNLREYLKKQKSDFKDKLEQIKEVVQGLDAIHNENLIHRDFHSGNLLIEDQCIFISDLGLSQPANYQKEEGKIFGVMPYVAPEVLQGHPYTKASDIYSFGIIAYELFANAHPYPAMDDQDLAIKVYQGYRPDIDKVPIPQLLKDLIKRCWDANPDQRPSANELEKNLDNWVYQINSEVYKYYDYGDDGHDEISKVFFRQYLEIVKGYNHFSKNTPYQIHPAATTTSKMIDTKEIVAKLQGLKNEEYHTGTTEELNLFNSNELNIQDEKGESSAQAKNNEIPIRWEILECKLKLLELEIKLRELEQKTQSQIETPHK
ncbi:MAG: hypothetical protein MRERV_13c031 [Mycoplasmataceae bacterium RV_VA103A]|nr:MAG: hypothetical protein MRERV_13c031 [Mycoplasmataceae bacterium RV_VA103A]